MSEQTNDISQSDLVEEEQLAVSEAMAEEQQLPSDAEPEEELLATEVAMGAELSEDSHRLGDPAADAVSDIGEANALIASLVEDIGKITEYRETDNATLEQFRESMEVVNTQVFELRGYLTRIERNHESQFKALQELIESQNDESQSNQTQNLLLSQLKTIVETRFDAIESKLAGLQGQQPVEESPTGTRITANQNALFNKIEQQFAEVFLPHVESLIRESTQEAEPKSFNTDRLEREIQELRLSLQNTMSSLRSELSHNARHLEHIAKQTRSSSENSDQASRWRLTMGSKVDALEHFVKEIIRELERSNKA
jgi:chromosome segregation ATPase